MALWRLVDGIRLYRWLVGQPGASPEDLFEVKDARGVAISRDGGVAVFRNDRGASVVAIDARGASRAGRIDATGHYQRVAASPDGSLTALFTGEQIDAFVLSTGRLIWKAQIRHVQSFDCWGDWVIAASGPSAYLLGRSAPRSEELQVVMTADEKIQRVAISSAGAVLAAAHGDKVSLVDLASMAKIAEIAMPAPVWRLTFSLDDSLLVTAHTDDVARFWLVRDLVGLGRYGGQEPVRGDFYTLIDGLGYAAYADAIVAGIRHEQTTPPLTIGVKGTWGAGKTSLMRMVEERLEWPGGKPAEVNDRVRKVKLNSPGPGDSGGRRQRRAITGTGEVSNRTVLKVLKAERRSPADESIAGDKVTARLKPTRPAAGNDEADAENWRTTVWFSPWVYQTGEQVWAGLAYEIITQVTERMSARDRERFWLRLNLARIDEQAVRRKIYGLVVGKVVPLAAAAAVLVLVGIAALLARPATWILPSVCGVPVMFGAIGGWQMISVLRSRPTGSLASLVQPAQAADALTAELAAGSYRQLVLSPDYRGRSGYFALVQADVQRVLDLVATPERPVVVFVDDLDRCSPGTVVQVIEAINTFLAGEYPNSIFVVAMEPDMVAAHIEAAYADLVRAIGEVGVIGDPTTALGWRFLEKIVQLPLTLPAMRRDQRVGYLASLFRAEAAQQAIKTRLDQPSEPHARLGISADPARPDTVQSAVAASPPDRPGPSGAERSQMALPQGRGSAAQELSADDDEVREAIAFAAGFLDPNPREIKRFANLFRFLAMIDSERARRGLDSLGDFKAIAKIAIVHVRWPDLVSSLGATRNGVIGYEVIETSARSSETTSAASPNVSGELAQALERAGLNNRAACRLAGADGLRRVICSEPHIGSNADIYF